MSLDEFLVSSRQGVTRAIGLFLVTSSQGWYGTSYGGLSQFKSFLVCAMFRPILLCGPQKTSPLISDGSAILTSEGVGLRVYDSSIWFCTLWSRSFVGRIANVAVLGFFASSWYRGYLSKLLQRGIYKSVIGGLFGGILGV